MKLHAAGEPRLSLRFLDGVAIAALLASWCSLRLGLPRFIDIGLFDETLYLQAGWSLLHRGELPPLQSGPLYAGWYSLWLAIQRDPLQAYWAQWLATDLCVLLLTYAVARGWRCSVLASTLLAFGWELLWVTTAGWPRVYFFALLLGLLAVFAAQRGRLGVALCLLAAAALVRPDDALALAAALTVWGWKRLPRRTTLVVTCVALLAGVGLLERTTSWGGGRLWVAFSQHAALRYAAAHPEFAGDAWVEHERLTALVFPHAHTVGQALHEAPREFTKLVATNLADEVSGLARWLGHWVIFDAPAFVLPILLLPLVFRNVRAELCRLPGVAIAWCAAASAAPSLLVMAKPTYSLSLLWTLAATGALGLDHLAQSACRRLAGGARVGTNLLVLAALPIAAFLFLRPPEGELPVRQAIEGMRATFSARPVGESWRMLDGDGGWCTYLDPGHCERVDAAGKTSTEPLLSFLARQRVNAVVLSSRLGRSASYANDPQFAELMADPGRAGFRVAFQDRIVRLLVKR